MYTFKPKGEKIGFMQPRSVREIKKERMFFSADVNYIEPRAGFITKNFLQQLDPSKDWVIDSRSHMLMPGWYPCIGGWHLDDVPRNTPNGQPNFIDPEYHAEHIIAVVDAYDSPTGSLTEFLTTEITLPEPTGKIVYGDWSSEINRQLKEGTVESVNVPNQVVVGFDAHTFHRGRPATGSGWRFFIRASTNTKKKVHNEIRHQVNVYIETEAGW